MIKLLQLIPAIAALCLSALVSPFASAENEIAGQAAPHLADYADSAIHWRAWGDAAFKEAKEKDRMVLAALGCSASYWTAEMRWEAFEKPAFAKLVNETFIPVKVDTLTRPGVWGVLRLYASLTGGDSSPPLVVLLTPEMHPTTSFGLSRTRGSESYSTIIKHVIGQWQRHKDYIVDQSKRDLHNLAKTTIRQPLADMPDLPFEDFIEPFYGSLAASFDPKHGGFDPGFKFPRPTTTMGLLDFARRQRPGSFRLSQCEKVVRRTLDGMLEGAIIDPLEGGIYRYSRDNAWRTPGFERRLENQALNAEAFAEAYQFTGDSRYADAARGILTNAERQLQLESGGYAASIFAVSRAANGAPPIFGSHDLWTDAELKTLLDDEEYTAARAAFATSERGNIPSRPNGKRLDLAGKNALRAATPNARRPESGSPLASAVEKLIAARNARPAPRRDDSLVASLNGLMISALAKAGSILGEPGFVERAAAAAKATRASLYDPANQRLARASREGKTYGQCVANDYIFLARGMIDLYRSGGDPAALSFASELQKSADDLFFDPEVGLYHLTAITMRDEEMPQLWGLSDLDLPSPNGVAALNLLDLAALMGTAGYRERAAGIVKAAGAPPIRNAFTLGNIARASLRLQEPAKLAIVSAPAATPEAQALLAAVRRQASSEVGIVHLTGENAPPELAARTEIAQFKPDGAGVKLYLCEDLKPVATITKLEGVAPAVAAFCRRSK